MKHSYFSFLNSGSMVRGPNGGLTFLSSLDGDPVKKKKKKKKKHS
jgi:hypothetical protein